jgi:hypothetical protein
VAFKTVTGFRVLPYTSFNGRGEPTVETPYEAIRAFLAMRIDYLYSMICSSLGSIQLRSPIVRLGSRTRARA